MQRDTAVLQSQNKHRDKSRGDVHSAETPEKAKTSLFLLQQELRKSIPGSKKISQGPQLQKNLKTEASVRMCPLPAGLWFSVFNPRGETLPVGEVLPLLLPLASFLN
ncbi:hypothetical protein QQF64_026474 [Cirrhinus molitorella]|uniref:Uncharacterized protein n=1 Tax=Cirrhinus molitorella TaxID=172907 RepID=A0ABR3N9P4_9TELE